ncbi:CPBP family intramembrane glutamic endopeptidase [Chamaesiphon sp. OTE_75_metabat_556]|uniref:CPBP family intramembrane glutamic endopeptidase n=1 Tax=Chamaesiphon sp. OTE_75_metabat_556 TaxID=2964692 RepID=UPI00286D06C5|nr:CPBP family intramembrane glutamic endopeptidase [Chamaesiphon sp. OTE_75_metabat_556]
MKSTQDIDRLNRNRSILALLLIVPITSIGALCSTVIAPGAIGQGIAICCGIWMLIFPLLWQISIERQPLRWKLSLDGAIVGILLGVLMFGSILGSYWLVGRYRLNIPDIRARVNQMGMNIPLMVFGFGTFQTLVNSLIEEYVWRWFVFRHCARLWTQTRAVWISAGFFTLHHIILLAAYCDDWRLVVIGSIAVFVAGVLWARCAKIYNSLLPSYLSHLAADLALQIASWHILLG